MYLRKLFCVLLLCCFAAGARSQTLIHYWSFNSLNAAYHNPGIPPIQADFSVLDVTKANVVYVLTATNQNYIGFWDNVAGDTANARNGFPASNALRFRNPSDSAEMRVYSPTTNYSNIVFKWEVESSSVASGQKTQLYDYSVDSGLTWKTSGLTIASTDITQSVFQGTSWGVITVGITDTAAFNNRKFVFRIKFSGNTNLTSGNNRIDNLTCEGTFIVPVSNVPLSLMDYWNFNTLNTAYHNPSIPGITPDFTTQDTGKTKLAYTLSPGTSTNYAGFIDNVAGDLTNARNGAVAGQALRFRNPSDSAELRLVVPTLGYTNIVVKYALQSSSVQSGQQVQIFDYSTDGGVLWKTTGLSIGSLDVKQAIFQGSNWGLVTVNLASDTTVNNNWNFIFRIRFSGGTTNASGNNRFDNITVEGTPIPVVAPLYTITSPKIGDTLTVGKHGLLNFTATGSVGVIRSVSYSTDKGLTWLYLGATTGTSFDFIVPNTPVYSNVYLRLVDEKENVATVGPLTIYYPGPGVITVTSPAKGDTLITNGSATINFTTKGVVSETRNVDYSIDSGKTWVNIGSVFQANTIAWTVASTPTTKALIRVRDTVNVIGVSNPFIIAAPAAPSAGKSEVIHYWNFDNVVNDSVTAKKPTIADLIADYSVLDKSKARVTYYTLPGLVPGAILRYIDPVAPGTDSNKRLVAAPGAINNGLRLRNPVDSMELRCFMPTTGHTNIVIKYALESSSTASGDSTDVYDYSVDGGLTWKNGKANGMKVNGSNVDTLDTTPALYQGTSWGVITIDLSADKTVENNPNFVFRVRFRGNTSKTSGNNRFDNLTVEGVAPSTQTLVYYWNFDNVVNDSVTAKKPAIADLIADYSILDKSKARVTYYTLPGLVPGAILRYIDPVAPGTDTNKRLVVAPGAINNGLRLRNPVDSMELRCFMPTTGYTNIIIKYALESSSTASGDSTDVYDYSVDGGLSWKNGKANGMKVNGSNVDTLDTTPALYQGTSWGLITIDLSADKTVENNANFVFRVRFRGNTSKTSGNNRFDNLTLEGIGAGSSGPAPSITVTAPALHDTLVVAQHKTITFAAIGSVGSKRTIEFSSDSAKTWSSVAVVNESSTYDWTVPNTLTGKGFIRVKDTTGVIGVSGMFAIVNPGNVVTVDVGLSVGTITPGDSTTIAWTTAGYLGTTVNIDLSLDSQKTWTSIKSAFAFKTASKYVGWVAPTGTHLGARIRLTFASGATGVSAPFDIKAVTAGVEAAQSITSVMVYPNPFTRNTTIRYELAQSAPVLFSVYDLLGRNVFHVNMEMESAGMHSFDFDGSHLNDGTYIYQLTSGDIIKQGKFIITR
jgi:hypothetical protein